MSDEHCEHVKIMRSDSKIGLTRSYLLNSHAKEFSRDETVQKFWHFENDQDRRVYLVVELGLRILNMRISAMPAQVFSKNNL